MKKTVVAILAVICLAAQANAQNLSAEDLARRAIERFAAERGYSTIDATVMDEARGAFGM